MCPIPPGPSVCVNTLSLSVVNSVFDLNRMTVGIHAGLPLLNSAIRPAVCRALTFLPTAVIYGLCVHAKFPTCSPLIYCFGGMLYMPHTDMCVRLRVPESMFASGRVQRWRAGLARV